MPSSADGFDAGISDALERVRDAARVLAPDRVAILIDGRSGAGKTTLAARLARTWPGPVQVVALDELYPGWDGLESGAETARTDILVPWDAGRPARWRRWNWSTSAPGDEAVTSPDAALIIEGSGVLTAASAPLAPIRVWLESPEDTRRERALARDGDTYRPHWERWADQEVRHLDRDDPRSLATIVVAVP